MKKIAQLLMYLALCTTFASGALAIEKHALIIANKDYVHGGSLTNPIKDSKVLARTLRDSGFKVKVKENLTLDGMRKAISDFGWKHSETDNVAMVYYSGHGAEFDGENYLIPVDAKLEDARRARSEALTLSDVQNFMYREITDGERASGKNAKGLNIIVLDACRNNPYPARKKAASRGLGEVEGASGTLIWYAAQPGAQADDGDGGDISPFAGAFSKALNSSAGESVEETFKKVASLTLRATEGLQEPWQAGNILGRFSFKPGNPKNDRRLLAKYDPAQLDEFVNPPKRSRKTIKSVAKKFGDWNFGELHFEKYNGQWHRSGFNRAWQELQPGYYLVTEFARDGSFLLHANLIISAEAIRPIESNNFYTVVELGSPGRKLTYKLGARSEGDKPDHFVLWRSLDPSLLRPFEQFDGNIRIEDQNGRSLLPVSMRGFKELLQYYDIGRERRESGLSILTDGNKNLRELISRASSVPFDYFDCGSRDSIRGLTRSIISAFPIADDPQLLAEAKQYADTLIPTLERLVETGQLFCREALQDLLFIDLEVNRDKFLDLQLYFLETGRDPFEQKLADILVFLYQFYPEGSTRVTYQFVKSLLNSLDSKRYGYDYVFDYTFDWLGESDNLPTLDYAKMTAYAKQLRKAQFAEFESGAWQLCLQKADSDLQTGAACYLEFIDLFDGSLRINDAKQRIAEIRAAENCDEASAAWRFIQDSSDTTKLSRFVREYSNCAEARDAEARIGTLQ